MDIVFGPLSEPENGPQIWVAAVLVWGPEMRAVFGLCFGCRKRCPMLVCMVTGFICRIRMTDRQTDEQTDRQTDRQTDEQTDRQIDRKTD